MQKPIIDSALTLEEALEGKEFPKEIRTNLTIIDIVYRSFDGLLHQGQLVVHKNVVDEVSLIFKELLERNFPIAKMIPVNTYEWDDDASMAANNTSAFNYRLIYGTEKTSTHAYGLAIDINPIQNPYLRPDGTVAPASAIYNPTLPGTVNQEIASIFLSRGWEWGGNWKQKDWQHFEKYSALLKN